MPKPAHSEVAQRFQRLLEETGLSREAFASAVDDAISPRSLFSVLNGHRRPSRALAVLIERTWGFRADFLLDGEGEMWTQPAYGSSSVGGSVLAPHEAAVVGYMRESVENARAMDEQLEIAETWAAMLAQLERLGSDLTASARTDAAAYPLLVRLFFEEVRWLGEQQSQFISLLHRRRFENLLDQFVERFLREVPASFLDETDRQRLERALTPLSARRADVKHSLEEAIAHARASLRASADPDAVEELARERAVRLKARRRALSRLAELADPQHAAEARALLSDLGADASKDRLVGEWLERAVRDVSREAAASLPAPRAQQTREARRERFAEILEAFAA